METPTTKDQCLALISDVVHILGGKWSFLVLSHLSNGTQRFNEMRRKLDNISTKSLTDTLRHLEKNGIVQRQVFPTVPVTVEYSLTDKGKDFESVLVEMREWGQKWKQ